MTKHRPDMEILGKDSKDKNYGSSWTRSLYMFEQFGISEVHQSITTSRTRCECQVKKKGWSF